MNKNKIAKTEKKDVYQIVTDRIIKAMEGGRIPWVKPWKFNGRNATIPADELCIFDCRKYRDGKRYSLLNQMLLGEDGTYLSYKEALEAGGHVKKGAESRIVVFWKWLIKDKVDDDGNLVLDDEGNVKKVRIPLLRYSNVFHIKDCEGVKPRKHSVKEEEPTEVTPVENVDIVKIEEDAEKIAEIIIKKYVDDSGVSLRICESDRAYYAPMIDQIVVPQKSQYKEQAEYYSTLFHEMTHSTGHKSRLDRFKPNQSMAARGEDYSKEELVAEIGAAMLVSYCGIDSEKAFNNSIGYLQGWLKHLRDDKRLIVFASGAAEKAVKFILGNDATENNDEDEGE